jgi:hypothetical protein
MWFLEAILRVLAIALTVWAFFAVVTGAYVLAVLLRRSLMHKRFLRIIAPLSN